MKKITRKIVTLLTIVLALMLGSIPCYASSDTDRINNYEIKIDVRQDGTLDIVYDIEWTVISDTVDPYPVDWVTVGIPNEHVDQIKGLSENIKSIKYDSQGGQSAVRIDFNKGYKKNEKFEFEFAIHQSYMYILDDGEVQYSFTPGWFEQAPIDNLQIEWATKNGFKVAENDSVEQSSSFYIWSYKDLASGEKVTANISYKDKGFSCNEDEQREDGESAFLFGVLVVIVIIIVIAVIFVIVGDDGYRGGRGYGGGGFFYSSCAHSSCAHSSCACACACAGGGRAGCSVKEFYFKNKSETTVSKDELSKVLKK